MTFDELIAVDGNPPLVLLKDGNVGMLTVFEPNRVGVQVPGEEYHRWLNPKNILRAHKEDSLREIDSPERPKIPREDDPEFQYKGFLQLCWK